MVVIGLGKAGCNVASCFPKSYKKILFSAKDFPSSCKKIEDFEENCPAFKRKLSFKEEQCYFVVCGSERISGATLALLEKIKGKKINIIYIYPDPVLMSPDQQLRNRVAFNVLQEYARSGLFNMIYLVSNKSVSDIVGDVSIVDYYSNLNSALVNVVVTLDYFNSQEPIFGSQHEPKVISRIATFAVGDIEKNEEKLLFPLDNITESCYIYSVSEEELQNNRDLISTVKSKILFDEDSKIISSFSVFSSRHEQSFFYSIKHTHFLQQEIK